MQFLKDKFNELLIAFLMLVFTGVVMFFAIKIPTSKALDFAIGAVGNLLGGLMLLIKAGGNPPESK